MATHKVHEGSDNHGRRNTRGAHENWRAFTVRLRDDTRRQIAELETMQADLQQWYSTKPGKPSEALELDQCPALLRVMQVIRLMRETLAEMEHELTQG